MKTLIKLIVIISLFFGTLYAQNINECKTDIYFGNGVWNSQDDAEKSIIQLQYNWSYGDMMDLLETFYQLKETGQIGEEHFFTFIDYLIKTADKNIKDENIKAMRQQIINLITTLEKNEVSAMVTKYYNESFKLSHKVLLISHSQGNLFANRVYDTINPTEYKNYFANMQIASPASEVKAQKGDYVTLSTDLTSVDPVINFIPGSMRPNASGESGHELVSAYLLQADPLSKITTKIKQLLANLDTEPSQWELDQELNVGTKDYKITLKHRFDTSITSMQDVEVYPFKPSEKLYHVIDNTGGNGWVKASCGGKEVFDYWDGQKENEVYLINNTQHEMILYTCNEGFHHDSDTGVCVINSPIANVTISIDVETHSAHKDGGNGWEVVTCNGNIPAYDGAGGVSANATGGRCSTWGLYPYVRNDHSYIGVMETAYAVAQEYLTDDINITKDWYSYDKVLGTVDGSAYDGYIYQKAFYSNIIPKVQ